MKRLLAAFTIVLFSMAPAGAMTRASAPQKFSIPFANSAATGTGPGNATYPLPTTSQIGIKDCAASLTDGFPPKSMQAVAAGGCAPFGQDINGIIKQITQWNQQTQAGAAPAYDSSFSSSIGGYPEGSILSQTAKPYCFWVSQVDNNTSNPDSGGANWTGTCPGGGIGGASTGTQNAQIVTTTPFNLGIGSQIVFVAGLTNSGSLQINVNGAGLVTVKKQTLGGLINLSGQEVQSGYLINAFWDGTFWQMIGAPSSTTAVNTQSGSYVIVPSDCSKVVLMTGAFQGVTLPAAAGMPQGCVITVTNGNTTRAQAASGFPIPAIGCGSGCIWQSQTLSMINASGSAWSLLTPGRYLFPNAAIFVGPAPCSDNNDGLTSATGSRMCNISAAVTLIQQAFDTRCTNPSINLADGTYTQLTVATGQGPHQCDGINLAGNPAAHSNVILNAPSNSAATFVRDFGILFLTNLVIGCTNAGSSGVQASQFATTDLTNITFGSCDGHQMMLALDGGHVDFDGGVSLIGNAASFLTSNGSGAQIEIENQVLSCTGSPNVGIFALASNLSQILATGLTFSGCGSVAGTRYLAQELGLIQTGTNNANFFPGSGAGSPAPSTLSSLGGLYR